MEIFGIVLFAAGILVSVSLHEAGHLVTAKSFGMKVTRYFVGFGPTLWSFRRGETEYGLKAIPLGGFCKIVGMTPQDDDVEPGDEARAMWRYPVWKRTVVMGAGSATHFALAIIAAYVVALTMGLPNPAYPSTDAEARQQPAVVALAPCVITSDQVRQCAAGDPASPARAAGLQDGDRIVAVNGTPVSSWEDMTKAVRAVPPGPATIEYQRDGRTATTAIQLAAVQRPPLDDPNGGLRTVSAMGVGLKVLVPTSVTYGPIDGVGATGRFVGDLAVNTVQAIQRVPEKVPALFRALSGGQRDADTPISVVGASRLGGEAAAAGLWELFVMLFISLNFFVGVFNLLPLLPVDGGHIAIAWFEKARSWVYARLGRADPGRVDYYKLMPVTYAVILIGGAFTLLTITADIVNPISIFSR